MVLDGEDIRREPRDLRRALLNGRVLPHLAEPVRYASAGVRALTRDKMAQCRWLEPLLVGQFEFVEWTADNHLRHSKFVGLREDKPARDVRRI